MMRIKTDVAAGTQQQQTPMVAVGTLGPAVAFSYYRSDACSRASAIAGLTTAVAIVARLQDDRNHRKWEAQHS